MPKPSVFIYVRTSPDKQRKELAATRQQALKAGFRVEREHADEWKETAQELDGRTALASMLDELGPETDKEPDDSRPAVMVPSPDTLASDPIHRQIVLVQFLNRGVRVIDSTGIDLASLEQSRTMTSVRQVIALHTRFERSLRALKMRTARDRMREDGQRVEGRKPYGTRSGEQEIIDRILSLRTKELSFAAIADRLNADGVKTRMGGEWKAGTVHKLVTDHSGPKD